MKHQGEAENSYSRPETIDSELALLGALLDLRTNEENFRLILSKVTEKCFTSPVRKKYFRALKTVYQRNNAIDMASVLNELGEPRDAYTDLMEESLSYAISQELIPYHVERVYGEYRVRVLKANLDSVMEMIDWRGDPIAILGEFQKAVIAQDKLNELQNSSTSMEMADSIIEYLTQLYSKSASGHKTGIYWLDHLLGGFSPKSYTVISGRSGQGKSDMSIYLATRLASKGTRVLYLSMEMPRTQIIERIAARVSKTNSVKLRDKQLSDAELTAVNQAIGALADLPITLDEQQNLTVSDIFLKIKQHRPDVVFLDHIGLMKFDSGKKQWESIQQVSKELKQIAMKQKIAFVVLVQQTRDVESRKDKQSNLSDLKGSDSIGNDADAVLFISAEKPDHFLTGDEFVTATLQVVKNRHGSTGNIHFNWYPQYHKYVEQERR